MKKSYEELIEIEKLQIAEAKRVKLSLELKICPECGNELALIDNFWNEKLVCICGFKKEVTNHFE